MYKVPIAELKEKILAGGKITADELQLRIKNKINELSGLISEEGAAHIIANELGIEIPQPSQGKLKIREIYAGMKSVTAVGKVVRKFEVREFSKGDRSGKVGSLIMGDETGTIRVVFWNDQTALLEKLQPEDIIQVKSGYVKENNHDRELHIGDKAEVQINPPGETVGAVRASTGFQRKTIQDLCDGEDGIEILGTVVQVFDPRFFYVCPQCNKRTAEQNGGHNCAQHGSVQPSLSYVLNATLDDGTGTIRGVFWKNQTLHLLSMAEENMMNYKENLAAFQDVKNDLLGEQFKVRGRAKRNEMFDRLELNVQLVEKADAGEELIREEKV